MKYIERSRWQQIEQIDVGRMYQPGINLHS